MIPNTISDTFQPIIDFSYGLDVEIRPKSGGAHPRTPPGASLVSIRRMRGEECCFPVCRWECTHASFSGEFKQVKQTQPVNDT